MSQENIRKFSDAAASDSTLQAKIQAIHEGSTRHAAQQIAALAAEAGAPFTAEEFLVAAAPSQELTEEQLESVAGGTWDASPGNILMSVLSAGLLCALTAGFSAALRGGNADHKDCQVKNNPERD